MTGRAKLGRKCKLVRSLTYHTYLRQAASKVRSEKVRTGKEEAEGQINWAKYRSITFKPRKDKSSKNHGQQGKAVGKISKSGTNNRLRREVRRMEKKKERRKKEKDYRKGDNST